MDKLLWEGEPLHKYAGKDNCYSTKKQNIDCTCEIAESSENNSSSCSIVSHGEYSSNSESSVYKKQRRGKTNLKSDCEK